jgi:hypothetical protein
MSPSDSRRPRVTGTHTTEMRYFIGEHDGIEYPFDRHVYRAYFYWREGNSSRTRSFWFGACLFLDDLFDKRVSAVAGQRERPG